MHPGLEVKGLTIANIIDAALVEGDVVVLLVVLVV